MHSISYVIKFHLSENQTNFEKEMGSILKQMEKKNIKYEIARDSFSPFVSRIYVEGPHTDIVSGSIEDIKKYIKNKILNRDY